MEEQGRQLHPGSWARVNWEKLNRLLADNAFQNRYACFDFDDTTSIHGVDSALLYTQIQHLSFVMLPEEFARAVAAGIPDLDRPLGVNQAGESVSSRQVMEDLIADYTWLFRQLERHDPAELRHTLAFRSFRAKLFWLRKGLEHTFPMEVTYPWCVYLMAGHRSEELYALGRTTVAYSTRPGGYGKVCFHTPVEHPGISGLLSVEVEIDVAFPPEMRDLYRALLANGIQPYIISASPMELVRAANEMLHLGLTNRQIFAMRMKRDAKGRYLPEYNYEGPEGKAYPQTFGPGKAQIIRDYLAPLHDSRGPVLVCGDGENDMDMMTGWMACGDTQAGLILNHDRSPESHPRLWQAAQEALRDPDSRYLLQGLDKRRGQFRPTQATLA